MHASKTLEVLFISRLTRASSPNTISTLLDEQPRHAISYTPWADFSYKPDCSFSIAHGNNCIFLKYYVSEQSVSAQFTQPNDLVYKDSCVEFFISFDRNNEYYNLEFNCLGTCYLAYGNDKGERQEAPADLIRKIKSKTFLYSSGDNINWELTLMIPNEVFFAHALRNLSLLTARANFYKCGDDLPTPHYLAWNQISSPQPNFHLPEFFGHISFSGFEREF
jgi:hypothetical protein